MNWWVRYLAKEATRRRFRSDDRVRYFTDSRKGKGKGIVLTPSFSKGTVMDYDSDQKHYRIRDHKSEEEFLVHPRNIIPDSIRQVPISSTPIENEPVTLDAVQP